MHLPFQRVRILCPMFESGRLLDISVFDIPDSALVHLLEWTGDLEPLLETVLQAFYLLSRAVDE